MKVLAALIGLLIGASMGIAQSTSSLTLSGTSPYYPKDGKISFNSHPAEPVLSLDQLAQTGLIVDATVLSNFPAISTNPDSDFPSALTESLVSVTEVMAGTLPGGTRTILLLQEGGKVGKWDVVVLDDPLVKPGERYILFLGPDYMKDRPNDTPYPRYWAAGIFSGKVKIENGKVKFLPSAVAKLREHNNTDVNAFIATLRDKISFHNPELKPRP
jgi:hypothetical protein